MFALLFSWYLHSRSDNDLIAYNYLRCTIFKKKNHAYKLYFTTINSHISHYNAVRTISQCKVLYMSNIYTLSDLNYYYYYYYYYYNYYYYSYVYIFIALIHRMLLSFLQLHSSVVFPFLLSSYYIIFDHPASIYLDLFAIAEASTCALFQWYITQMCTYT